MSASRVRKALGLVAAAAAAVLVVGLASPARAQDCNGALNITIPFSPKAVPPTGPYLNVGDSTTVKLNLGSGTITGGTQITFRRLRYELDCNHLAALGVPCTDQGDIMSYDFTQTVASGGALVQCQGRTWTATAGSTANEVVFTPDTPIVLPPEQTASPTVNSCFISFQVKLDNLEPTSGGDSDDTPVKVEVVGGCSTVISSDGHADAECDNGGASGITNSSGIFICPSCMVDQCNLGCDTTTGTCKPADVSTPCTDIDGNTCTTAGCELSADLGVCVQTHLFAENSTPCADSDGNACTTAGCNAQGVCDQNHNSKVCPPADECNKGCDTTSGQCTPQVSTPCGDTDGNTCTTAGCEVSTSNAELGVCVQTHMFASNSTPCADSDGNACTTAGCNGQGLCDQNHSSKVCPPADECNKGCDTTSGQCTPQVSTPCGDTDGNTCTTAGCEISTSIADLGVCVQTHMFASNSTPCADSDNNACTTAGCNGQGTCDQAHLTIQSTSNCANPIVGAATDCSVLELDGGSVSITGPSGVVGDICVGPGGTLRMTGGSFTTSVRLDASATFTQSGGGSRGTTFQPVDLSPEINDANAAVTNAGSLNCDLNLGTITANTTITATANPTVACVDNINLSGGKVITLSGASGTSLIIRVTGAFNLSGSSKLIINTNSGLQPKDVLYDLVGSGSAVTVTGGGQIDGTILAPDRDVKLSVVKVNGEVISGKNITIVSGAAVKCPPSPCVPTPG